MTKLESESHIVNVVTQNVLLDYRRTKSGLVLPQGDRIASIAESLSRFPGTLDVVGIQEAQKSKTQHNGQVLARQLGYGPGFWFNHNQKLTPESSTGRSGEYIGLFGESIDHAEAIDLGDQRKAVITTIAGVAFVTLHLRSRLSARAARLEQVKILTSELDAYNDAVVFGDFNEPPITKRIAKAHHHLKENGFSSVFPLTGQPNPITSPIGGYKKIFSEGHGWRAPLIRKGFSIDDILVRGSRISVLGAGVLERVGVENINTEDARPNEASDHEGVWAQLDISPKT